MDTPYCNCKPSAVRPERLPVLQPGRRREDFELLRHARAADAESGVGGAAVWPTDQQVWGRESDTAFPRASAAPLVWSNDSFSGHQLLLPPA